MANSVLQSPRNPHFFQPLLPGFHNYLNIPLKFFSKHIQGRNERNTAEVRSDACKNTWKVKMEGRRLTDGWKEFTIAHDLRIGDIVIFRHEGDLVFHVTCFGPSCTEIQYDVQPQDNIGNLSEKQNLKTERESFSSDQSCFVARVTCSNLREDTMFLPRKFVRPDGLKKSSNKISLINEGARTWTLILKFRESSRTFYMRSGWRSFAARMGSNQETPSRLN
ncbi:LOW QUALITY PROTEIN: B3 domain-containing protein REM7 [Eutrema salsugineum]|uniref:LOW QUALITY PROTEIN: B3 domain-containing protein REM7 n=1 Tax=Eutrema salsugineum TaxID=72664 RepID=UPI000CED3356|nr:LOW QUALITY PROTEIN: B3 domain-containing protein REM7 [Eutrema salsugineum]